MTTRARGNAKIKTKPTNNDRKNNFIISKIGLGNCGIKTNAVKKSDTEITAGKKLSRNSQL